MPTKNQTSEFTSFGPSSNPIPEGTIVLHPVRKTAQMVEIEAAHGGKDIRIILKELYEKTGSQLKVAEALGLDQATISIWAARLGMQFTSTPVALIAGQPEPA